MITRISDIYLYSMILVIFTACHRDAKLEKSLSISGKNRVELEKVLMHYKNDSDILKLKAAKFLICNMPNHNSYVGAKIKNFYNEMDNILNADTSVKYKNEIIKKISMDYSKIEFETDEDLKIISADYLIKNIDEAFDKWRNRLWTEHISFKQFCELLLPYKCFEYQQLDNWRDSLSAPYVEIIEKQLLDDYKINSVHNMATLINQKISSSFSGTGKVSINKPMDCPFMNLSISKVSYDNCYGAAMLSVLVMRSLGIPVAMDYTPHWGKKEGSHAWYTLLSDNGKFLPFPWGLTSSPGDVFFPYDPIPKIFRVTYEADKRKLRYFNEVKYKYNIFNIFEKDVTDEYMQTSNIQISLKNRKVDDKYVYLSVLANRNWTVVDFGMVHKNQALFRKVGRDIVYLVLEYNGKNLSPISYPFILRKNDTIEYLTADTNQTRKVILYRKYPKPGGVSILEKRIVGGQIHASNDKLFTKFDSLYTITNSFYPDLIPLITNKKYRYWRYMSSKGGYCNIAELQFYKAGTDTIAKGNIIGTERIYQNDQKWAKENAFDGDWLTIFHAEQPSGGWVGLDFGQPISIDRVRCIPRSDDNNVRVGDYYELLYWGKDDWVSLGIKEANERSIKYNLVPENALLLLRNLTRGKQERIFIYKKEKQIWW